MRGKKIIPSTLHLSIQASDTRSPPHREDDSVLGRLPRPNLGALVDGSSEPAEPSPQVLVAIPAYNEADTIGDVVREAESYADAVVVVDDGSSDATANLAAAAGAEVVEHDTNRGYGSALQTAFAEAADRDADHLVILDGDGQHDPGDIPRAVGIQQETGSEIVIGSRFAEGSETDVPLLRRVGIEVVNALTNLRMGIIRRDSWVRDTQSGFRVYDRQAIESLRDDDSVGEGMHASTDILHHAFRQDYDLREFGTTVDYEVDEANNHDPIAHGLTLVANLLQTLQRERPVMTLGLPGFTSSFIGIGIGYWALHTYLQTGAFPLVLVGLSTFFLLLGIFACFIATMLHALGMHLDD